MKKMLPIAIILILLVGIGVFLVSNSYTKSSTPAAPKSPSTQQQPAATTAPTSQAVDKITISNFKFDPSALTVKKGTSVTWTNQDAAAHTVMETDGQQGPSSQNLNKGQSYSFTFSTVGTFHYNCSIHPSMTGTVVVTE